ncbi:hypothetical protein HDU67_009247 [Dinochytrium kinnereticum]|nr:hypothetical protein HDU67_009247 [Dinochytrium kinnereticum]
MKNLPIRACPSTAWLLRRRPPTRLFSTQLKPWGATDDARLVATRKLNKGMDWNAFAKEHFAEWPLSHVLRRWEMISVLEESGGTNGGGVNPVDGFGLGEVEDRAGFAETSGDNDTSRAPSPLSIPTPTPSPSLTTPHSSSVPPPPPAPSTSKPSSPEKIAPGARWTLDEEARLRKAMNSGADIERVWKKHFKARSLSAVKKRWLKIRNITNEQNGEEKNEDEDAKSLSRRRAATVNEDSNGSPKDTTAEQVLADEDAKLLKAVFKLGPKWTEIGEMLDKSPDQSRRRFWALLQKNPGIFATEMETKARIVENPFDVPIDIRKVKATIKYKGETIAEIDQLVTEFTIPANGSATSPPMDLTLKLSKGSLGLLFAALGGERKLSVASTLVIDGGLGYTTDIQFVHGASDRNKE